MDVEEEEQVDFSIDEEDEQKDETEPADAAEDIYGDLYDAEGEKGTLLKSKNAALQEQCQGQEATIQKLRHKIEELISELRNQAFTRQHAMQKSELTEERRILIRNISCLYRTAREELYRRDDELKRRARTIEDMKAQERQRRAQPHVSAAPNNVMPAAMSHMAEPLSAGVPPPPPLPPPDLPPPPLGPH